LPKETDDYGKKTWEEIALRLAGWAGIAAPCHELLQVGGKAVLLSRRFDRDGAIRIPFLSAMATTGSKDGERGSYPEIVDALTRHGAQAKTDAQALYRRAAFNVLVSNVDDHLRNRGFLWLGKAAWSLSPSMMRIQCRPPRENRERCDRLRIDSLAVQDQTVRASCSACQQRCQHWARCDRRFADLQPQWRAC